MNHASKPLGAALVLDDDEFAAQLAAHQCRSIGFNPVLVASDGPAALAQVDSQNLALILCDLRMPGMDGLAFLRQLCARRFNGQVALLSGVDGPVLGAAQQVAKSFGLEVVGAIGKPITLEALRAALFDHHGKGHRAGFKATAVKRDDLERGLAARELVLHFQPKVDVTRLETVGVEALVRWQHPEHGLLMPLTFVPLAEESGLIVKLTRQVFEMAVLQAKAWRADGLGLKISVNVSMEDLRDSALPDLVSGLLAEHGVSGDALCVEVTETRLIEDLDLAREVLTRLRLLDIMLSIDDFGTGYASLDKLRHGPFQELKIDRAFVNGAGHDESLRAILISSADLGVRLGMQVTAEGVEDLEDWTLAARAGATLVQGYLVSKPLPAEELKLWLQTPQAWKEQVRANRNNAAC